MTRATEKALPENVLVSSRVQLARGRAEIGSGEDIVCIPNRAIGAAEDKGFPSDYGRSTDSGRNSFGKSDLIHHYRSGEIIEGERFGTGLTTHGSAGHPGSVARGLMVQDQRIGVAGGNINVGRGSGIIAKDVYVINVQSITRVGVIAVAIGISREGNQCRVRAGR